MSQTIDQYSNKPPASKDAQQLTMIIYILYGAAIFVGLTSIVAVVINYIKRNDVRGTWLESHFDWQIKTFWWTLIWGIVGSILTLLLVGFGILFVLFIWYIYRVAKGLLYLNERRPIS